MPPPETPGHSGASLGQSLVGSLLLSPGSWCTQVGVFFVCVCALLESIFQSCVSSGSSMVGIMATSSKRAYVISRFGAPRAPAPWQATADLYFYTRHSHTVLAQSLWGLWVMVYTRFVWALWTSVECMGFDSKSEFAPPTILLGLLLCHGYRVSFFGGIKILLSIVYQQQVVILEFLQRRWAHILLLSHLEAFRLAGIARRDKKVFLTDWCKEIEENNRTGKTRDPFKKIRDTKGNFHAKLDTIKDRNGMALT